MIANFSGEHAFLSNFFLQELEFHGTMWRSSEHAYQACKTLDLGSKSAIQAATTPGQAKRLGRFVELRGDWNAVRIAMMRDILVAKFAPGTDMLDRLHATGDHILVEGNSWGDRFWGATLQPHATLGPFDRPDWGPVVPGSDQIWIGKNQLGLLLMAIRAGSQF